MNKWLDVKKNEAKCPNCLNPISVNDLIPIYGKSEEKQNTNRFKIPKRPQGQRNTGNEPNNNVDKMFIKRELISLET